jgi:hypothetical protein
MNDERNIAFAVDQMNGRDQNFRLKDTAGIQNLREVILVIIQCLRNKRVLQTKE